MSEERFAIASFAHKNNILVGTKGRILWAAATTCTQGIHRHEGWVLPGGERTQDSARAHAAALQIDRMSAEPA